MGCTIVLSTHILSDVERVANRIGIMRNGVLAEEGSLKELLRRQGGDVINITVRGLTQENKIKLLSVDFARAEYNNDEDLFRFGTEDAEDSARRLMRLMADNDIVAENFSIGTATLEEVFGKVVG